ncbi:hypothetical protein Bbelb_013380 [Branchiostoma belcheri]|nr:hypothetical protein Bbelb_013380 [Branchiostoma belcheri]
MSFTSTIKGEGSNKWCGGGFSRGFSPPEFYGRYGRRDQRGKAQWADTNVSGSSVTQIAEDLHTRPLQVLFSKPLNRKIAKADSSATSAGSRFGSEVLPKVITAYIKVKPRRGCKMGLSVGM